MSLAQINITLGTAGHIDHGKTALVKCLTGCETDRLKEEKERGMSIDLGFAPCTIADVQVGIVDVPGHENFVRTMVAGASGMDGVILVVAADDGVMPQTREHLDILTLLGIRHGLVALTKIDRVEAEQLELAEAELADFLRGTFLEGAPILPISNVTGAGFDAFLESLAQLVNSIEPKRIDGVFRLPIERAFSVQGYGTVVAGIPVAGAAHAGDEVLLLPAGLEGRIKRIEVYGRAGDTVMAGQCAALNVGHWDHRAIRRGDVLTQPGYFTPREWHAATVRLLPRPKLNVKNGAEVRFHTGTSETNAAVYAVEGQRLQGGSECLIQIRTKAPIVAGPGDHFILRKLSPVETIGGGVLIEASEERLKRNRPEVIEDLRARAKAIGEPKRFVEYAVRRAQRLAASPAELASRTKVPHERLQAILADLLREERILSLPGGLYAHRDTAAEVGQRILALVADFHRQTPESPGIAWEQLRQSAACDKAVLDGLIAVLAAQNRLVVKNDRLALPEHRAAFSDEQAGQAAQIEELFRTGAFHPPGVEEVAQRTGLARGRLEKILRTLCEQGRLVPVEELWFHREAVEKAQDILVALLEKEGRLESVRFKYLLDTARKFAIPLLDHFDRIGVTRRSGNTRYLKRPAGGK